MTRSGQFPHINAPSIASALQQVKPTFDCYKSKLDKMTSDIREVESFLKQSAYTQHFVMHVAGWASHPEIAPYPKKYDVKNPIFSEHLSWQKLEDQNSFRLYYELLAISDFTEEMELIYIKPLIETSVLTRKRMFPFIPKFLISLSEELSINGISDSPSIDDLLK